MGNSASRKHFLAPSIARAVDTFAASLDAIRDKHHPGFPDEEYEMQADEDGSAPQDWFDVGEEE